MAMLAELNDWEAACGILGDLDYEAQYIAIRALLRRQSQADASLEKEMDEIAEFAKRATGFSNEQAVEEWGVSFHASIFQSAAHSMAAAGMLAPFVESLFVHAYRGIHDQQHLRGALVGSHPRWAMADHRCWDPHFASPDRGHLVDGIFELAEATGLAPHMPRNLRPTLNALFAYRNKMFHCGFEWPSEQRTRFAARINTERWPESWFGKAMTGGEPWVFYLSDEFVTHGLATIEAVLKGFGAFVRERANDGISLETSPWPLYDSNS
jgi:hypothetical protein